MKWPPAYALLLAGLLASPAWPQEAAQPLPATETRPYPMTNTQVIRIPAKALGRDYEYVVTLPFGYDASPDRQYPCLLYTSRCV